MKLKPFPLIRNDGINFSNDIQSFREILIYNLTVSRAMIIDLKCTLNLNDLDYFCLYIGILHGPVTKKLSIVFNKNSGKINCVIFDVINNSRHERYTVELIATKRFNYTFVQLAKNLK